MDEEKQQVKTIILLIKQVYEDETAILNKYINSIKDINDHQFSKKEVLHILKRARDNNFYFIEKNREVLRCFLSYCKESDLFIHM